jgi:hypothetical protein
MTYIISSRFRIKMLSENVNLFKKVILKFQEKVHVIPWRDSSQIKRVSIDITTKTTFLTIQQHQRLNVELRG